MRNESSKSTGLESSNTTTSGTFTGQTSAPSISCAADSPAKTLASAGATEGSSTESDRGSGESTRGSSTKRGRRGSSLKTSQLYESAGCPLSSATFTRAGTMRSGTVYPLQPSAPVTSGIGSSWSRGLHPTPTATPYGSGQNGINGRGGEFERPSAKTPSLWSMARSMGGKLDPLWLEWAMGFPANWTELEGLETP